MNRHELLKAFKQLTVFQDNERRKGLLECNTITDEEIRKYMLDKEDDALMLTFVKFILDMDEKLDKILEKLSET